MAAFPGIAPSGSAAAILQGDVHRAVALRIDLFVKVIQDGIGESRLADDFGLVAR